MSPHCTRRKFLTAAGSTAALAGCAAPHAADSREQAAQDQRQTQTQTPTAPQLERLWDTPLPGKFTLSAPITTDQTLYIGSSQYLHALSRDTGEISWSTELGALTHRFRPAVAEDTVIMAARNMVGTMLLNEAPNEGRIAGINLSNGNLYWQIPDQVTATPAATPDQVFVPISDQAGTRLTALDPALGTEQWSTTVGGQQARILWSPTVGDDRVYVSQIPQDQQNQGRIIALSTANGAIEWSARVSGKVGPLKAVSDGVVFGTADGQFSFVEATTGERRWQHQLADGVYTQPTVTDGSVYVADNTHVRRFTLDTGKQEWETTVASVNRTGIEVTDGTVYAGGIKLSAIDAVSGELEWEELLPPGMSGTFGEPTVSDGTIYSGSCIKQSGQDPYDHHVYAFQ